jgi:hypothetical protein
MASWFSVGPRYGVGPLAAARISAFSPRKIKLFVTGMGIAWQQQTTIKN